MLGPIFGPLLVLDTHTLHVCIPPLGMWQLLHGRLRRDLFGDLKVQKLGSLQRWCM
jgi:hypothetical protein